MKRSLDEIKNSNPFTVPEGYFDSLTGRIQARIQVVEPKQRPIFISVLKWSMVPAMVLVGFIWYMSNPTSLTPDELLAEVSNEEIMYYLDQSGLDESELITLLGDDADFSTGLEGIELDENGLQDLLDEYDLDDEVL